MAVKPGLVTESYHGQITASGGTAPYAYTINKDYQLPPYLSLTSDGKICGKPTKAGTFRVMATAIDRRGFGGTRTFTLTIKDK